jgi:hypothetical protein
MDGLRATLGLLAAMAAAAWTQEAPTASAAVGAFGLPDASGKRLIAPRGIERPAELTTALCTDGQRLRVRFEGKQAEGKQSTGRETSGNFASLAGDVYRAIDGKIDPWASCLLPSPQFMTGATVVPLQRMEKPAPCAAEMTHRIGEARHRAVTHCWTLARSGAAVTIALVEFARIGKDALASAVLLDGPRMMFEDYAAEFREEGESLWRVDDGGELSPEGFRIVCLLRAPAGYALAVAWAGTEGRSLSVSLSTGGRFKTAITDYWYQMPL